MRRQFVIRTVYALGLLWLSMPCWPEAVQGSLREVLREMGIPLPTDAVAEALGLSLDAEVATKEEKTAMAYSDVCDGNAPLVYVRMRTKDNGFLTVVKSTGEIIAWIDGRAAHAASDDTPGDCSEEAAQRTVEAVLNGLGKPFSVADAKRAIKQDRSAGKAPLSFAFERKYKGIPYGRLEMRVSPYRGTIVWLVDSLLTVPGSMEQTVTEKEALRIAQEHAPASVFQAGFGAGKPVLKIVHPMGSGRSGRAGANVAEAGTRLCWVISIDTGPEEAGGVIQVDAKTGEIVGAAH